MSDQPLTEPIKNGFCAGCSGPADKRTEFTFDQELVLILCRKCRYRLYRSWGEGVPQTYAEFVVGRLGSEQVRRQQALLTKRIRGEDDA